MLRRTRPGASNFTGQNVMEKYVSAFDNWEVYATNCTNAQLHNVHNAEKARAADRLALTSDHSDDIYVDSTAAVEACKLVAMRRTIILD